MRQKKDMAKSFRLTKIDQKICNPIKPSRLEANVQIGDGWLVWDNVYWFKWCKKNRMPNAPSK